MTQLLNAANELKAAKTFSDAENDRLKTAIEQLGKTV
jgi:hypothetical protein